MGKKRTLQQLTIKDNFMFTTVMTDEANCLGFLERALDMQIDHVVVDKEKSLIYHPDYHGIRLDVYAKGISKAFNIEMQIQPKYNLPRRVIITTRSTCVNYALLRDMKPYQRHM